MKSIESLIKDSVRNLKPCIHGAELLGAAEQSGIQPEAISDFSSSVNPLGPSKKALESAKEAFSQIAAYPDSNSNQLRRIIAAHFGIDKAQIVVGNGSTELMYLFADVFLNQEDKVVMPAPTFGEYESAVCKTGETPIFVKLNDKFSIDVDAFKHEMTGAKMVFLCNPNNPTSMLIPKEALTEIVETALEQNTLVFLDEDFLEFVEGERSLSMISQIDEFSNLFILRSFTKIFGLTGLRVGYGIANKDIIDMLTRAKIPWNVNCIGQAAAVAALNDDEHLRVTLEVVNKEKKWLAKELCNLKGFSFSMPDANFFFIDVHKSGFTATELKNSMLKKGLLIRDCTSFKGLDEYYIRVAVKTHDENLRLIEAFKRIIKPV
jgi:threonine-phosphate decarboxylase